MSRFGLRMVGSSGAGNVTRGYHHGDLRHALIAAAETLLSEQGVEGFTLRECARRAGVSPAAPAHHFGNKTGLLTAIATLGFEGLCDAMEEAARGSLAIPVARLQAIGLGYIRFALSHPARFRVMFGRFPLDHADPVFCKAGARAFDMLAQTVAAQPGQAGNDVADQEAALVLAWSAVHGLANLVLDGQVPFVEQGADRDVALMALARRVVALVTAATALPRGQAAPHQDPTLP